jgi:hypothetical protein
MTDFLFALHDGATSQQEAIVSEGLAARFPNHQFMAADGDDDLENAIIPIVGSPHPTDPDAVIVTMPLQSLVDEVSEAFAELAMAARAAKPS